MTRKGNPRCSHCRGAGVVPTPNGYTVCECVRGTPQTRALLRRASGVGARNPDGDAVRKALQERGGG